VKQPIENLILSTSMRLAIVGFVKTISQEISDKQITFNILAPGYHRTKAIERLVKKKCEMEKSTFEEGLKKLEKNLPMGKLGLPDDFAPLALFLLSQHSQYITGQVYAVDGGLIKSTL
ncbi:MAG: SDR family oxidoreductase, partial [Bacteroidales bacterium]|nr:SDR family oxidoreductase [Bacteroidales bacterium]